MKKNHALLIGNIALLVGVLILVGHYAMLPLIQSFDMQTGSWLTNAMDYGKKPTMAMIRWIAIGVMVYGGGHLAYFFRVTMKEKGSKIGFGSQRD